MKSYEVELKRTSYVSLYIEADSKEEAEEKAWQAIEAGYGNINDAQWEVESIQESIQGETK